MGIIINHLDNPIVKICIAVAHPMALNHFSLAQTELNGLNAIAQTVVSRQNNRVSLGIVFTLEYTMLHLVALFLISLQ